jgi:hypothetical protein
VKNPHHEHYKKELTRRRGSNFKNNNADMIHIMADKKSNSKLRRNNDTLIFKTQNSIKEEQAENKAREKSDRSSSIDQ